MKTKLTLALTAISAGTIRWLGDFPHFPAATVVPALLDFAWTGSVGLILLLWGYGLDKWEDRNLTGVQYGGTFAGGLVAVGACFTAAAFYGLYMFITASGCEGADVCPKLESGVLSRYDWDTFRGRRIGERSFDGWDEASKAEALEECREKRGRGCFERVP